MAALNFPSSPSDGDTYTPSGSTITYTYSSSKGSWQGQLSGSAATVVSLTGSTNNQLTTVTGANAIQGESNLTFDGSTLAVTGAVTISSNITVEGTTTLNGNLVLGDAAADTLTIGATLQGASPLTFEGGTANGFETTFAITDPTADRTVKDPNNFSYPYWNPQTNNCNLNQDGSKSNNFEANGTSTYGDQIFCKCEKQC